MIVVAGHICLDIIPSLSSTAPSLGELMQPGKLLEAGPVTLSTGGAVANTGLGLHKLGYPVRLMGKVGGDAFGDVLLALLRAHGPALADGMIRSEAAGTSYTVVISPPGIDRVFIHHPGANDDFDGTEIDVAGLSGAHVFHFGYPPLMRRLYSDDGSALAALLRKVRPAVTSLDMAMPDPGAESGRANWRAILARALPETDLFLPSLDELAYMLGRKVDPRDASAVGALADEALGLGAAVVALKLGDHGLYLRTSGEAGRLTPLADSCGCDTAAWVGREIWAPCYETDVVGTTGAGDVTIAGFLGAVSEGRSPEECANLATAAGASACEAPDATGGVRSRAELDQRRHNGWRKRPLQPDGNRWQWDEAHQLWLGKSAVMP